MDEDPLPPLTPSNAEAGPGPTTMASVTLPAAPPANGLAVPSDPAARAELLRQKEEELAQVVDRHDDMIRELFHMERFVTMVTGYDPVVAKRDKSAVFMNYQAERDLVTRFATSTGRGSRASGRTTRRAFADRKGSLALVAPRGLKSPPGRDVNGVALLSNGKSEHEGGSLSNGMDQAKPRPSNRRQMVEVTIDSSGKRGKQPEHALNSTGEGSSTPRSGLRKDSRRRSTGKPSAVPSRVSSRVKAAGVPQETAAPAMPDTDGRMVSSSMQLKRKFSASRAEASVSGKRRRRSLSPFEGPIPPPRYTEPEQRPNPDPPFNHSLSAFLSSFRVLDDKEVEESALQAQAVSTARVLNRIKQLQSQGRILDHVDEEGDKEDSTPGVIAAPFRPPPEPKRLPDHRSNLLAHMTQVGSAIKAEHKTHVYLARKVAKAVQAHFDLEKGKDQRMRKEEERRKKTLMKELVRGLKAKWKLAVNVIRAQKVAAAKLEQERLGQAHLQSILARSTGLIQAHKDHISGKRSVSQSDTEDEENADDDEQMSVSGSSRRSSMAHFDGEPEGIGDEQSDDFMDLLEDSDGATEEEEAAEDSEEDEGIATEDSGDLGPALRIEDASGQPSPLPEVVLPNDAHPIPADGMELEAEESSVPALHAPQQTVSTPTEVKVEEADADDKEFQAPDEDHERDLQLDVQMEAEEGEVKTDSEDEGLLADVDVPIEELLARYGYGQDVLSTLQVPKANQSTAEDGVPASAADRSADVSEPNGAHENNGLSVRRSGRVRKVKQFRDSFSPVAKMSSNLEKGPSGEEGEPEEEEDDEEEEDEEEDEEDTFQPTSDDAVVRTPFLLRGQLRPYQQAGLEWLAGLYKNKVNGILADEMGLGKTIQTIALLAHLACDKGVWGPHLIVVPTSVILNWEMEFKKFLPGMKVLTYYGNQKERKEKRVGWATEHFFQVCITSYQLVLADQHIFRRKNWQYLVLDEAHNIKNFRSQRWQTLLGFKSQRRLLLTGTPLQNNLMELWSLMYFLMPNGASAELSEASGFANHREFMEWFSNPMDKAVETGGTMSEETRATIDRLHTILRPYMLRRLKSEVETQLPGKHEHVIYCRLSKRQRFLYDEFMSRASTRESLISGGYLGVANCLMQLRKVCNHPDLFEVRPVRTSFAMGKSVASDFGPVAERVYKNLLMDDPESKVDLDVLNLRLSSYGSACSLASQTTLRLDGTDLLPDQPLARDPPIQDSRTLAGWQAYRDYQQGFDVGQRWRHIRYLNRLRCARRPTYGSELLSTLRRLSLDFRTLPDEAFIKHPLERESFQLLTTPHLVQSLSSRAEAMAPVIDRFAVITPNATTKDLAAISLPSLVPTEHPELMDVDFDTLHRATVKLQIAFPDASLLQYDCGKLQVLHDMLKELKAGGHRVIIFTQMTKMLDILELFLSYNGHRYFRLDGGTKIEDRQRITERFNSDERIFAFIASTRAGGVGINLTGADTVIFYDADYNVAMDRQAMDRAHRIGQTREVNIYRLVTSHTVEENILRKSNQKRMLDTLVIQEGNFTTDFFGKLSLREMLGDDILQGLGTKESTPTASLSEGNGHREREEMERALAAAEDAEDAEAARIAQGEVELDNTDFDAGDISRSRGGSGSATPAPGSAVGSPAVEELDRSLDGMGQEDLEEEGEDAEPGSIDEYMLRQVEWDWDYFS